MYIYSTEIDSRMAKWDIGRSKISPKLNTIFSCTTPNLINYFKFKACLCVWKLALIPAVVLQNVTDKSSFVGVMSISMYFGSPVEP